MATHEVPFRNGLARKKNEKKGDKNEVTDPKQQKQPCREGTLLHGTVAYQS